MALDVALLRSSFELVAEREPQLTVRFYEILFDRYPQVRPLFGVWNRRQAQMLQDALVAVVDHLDDAPWLATTLADLGGAHVGYGVTPEMFGWVGECLLATLADAAGADWTPALEAAWAEAYGAVVSMMKAGMDAVASAPAKAG